MVKKGLLERLNNESIICAEGFLLRQKEEDICPQGSLYLK